MKERPILFSASMVRALLAGTKTQTRRVAKINDVAYGKPVRWVSVAPATTGLQDVSCPYGQPGDRLWVREAWAPGDEMVFGSAKDDPETVLYRADKAALHWDGKAMSTPMDTYALNWDAVRWKPSIHMPRWASRITLEVTGVRVERLQEISEDDLAAEGIQELIDAGVDHDGTPRDTYRVLWEGLNGPDSWDANPWVWVVEFKRL